MPNLNHIKLLILDVDGVLTDGSIIVNDQGVEAKRFHVRDGLAIKIAQNAGLQIAVITGRATNAVNLRITELGIKHLIQGAKNKATALKQINKLTNTTPQQVAYVGDDLIDLPAMTKINYPIAVADAAEPVQHIAKFITTAPGGKGAVRQAIEHILQAQNKWDDIVKYYLNLQA